MGTCSTDTMGASAPFQGHQLDLASILELALSLDGVLSFSAIASLR